MEPKDLIRQVGPLATRAAFQPKSVNEDARTVDVTWSTGESVKRYSWSDGPYIEALNMDPASIRMGRLASGTAPFLSNHDSSDIRSVIGIIQSASVANGLGTATVRFAKDDPEADAAWNKVRQGITPNVSVGYRIHKMTDVSERGDEVPTLRADDWEPFEISLVPMGADSAAHVRGASNVELNSCVFKSRGSAPQKEVNMEPKDEVKAAAELAARNAEIEAVKAKAVKEATERAAEITTIVRKAKLDASLAEKMIKDNKSLDEVRAFVLDEIATRSEQVKTDPHPKFEQGETSREKFLRGTEAWLHEKAGNGVVQRAIAAKVKGFEKYDSDGGEFRGMGIADVARACLERAGVKTGHIHDKVRLVEMAFAQRGDTGYTGTSDFAVLFENVYNKQMRAAYAVQADTWSRWIGTRVVPDYRAANLYLNGAFGTLPVVAEGEEYKNVAIPDGSKVQVSVEKRGAIISITEEAIINDDMGALADQAARFGAGAARSIETQAYAQLALNSGLGPTMSDSNPFFYSGRGNVSTGAALSGAALTADRKQFRMQQDASAVNYLDVLPSILLVPVALEYPALALNTDPYDQDSSKFQKINLVRGMFQDIVTNPRLDGVSTTRRYLFSANKEAFQCVFLEGTGEGPVLTQSQDFRRDGMSWKAKMTFKVNPFDPKMALTNAGV